MLTRISKLFIVGVLAGLLISVWLVGGVAHAQAVELAPPEIPGEAIYVPFPVTITVDGDLTDWSGVPVQTVAKGPMPSADPKEDGSFTFSVAADDENLYITMQAADVKIIAGRHDADYWNEDSLEFYLNLSGDFNLSSYTDDVYQVNINAADIGNTDPAALTVTGLNGGRLGMRGFVFKTKDGWGFEAACPRPKKLKLAHGYTIGFQAQLNGASEQDRNVKLIWSNADVNDSSWQTPAVFGRAIMFEVGRSDIPPLVIPPTPTPTATPVPLVSVNQTAYHPHAVKRAVLAIPGAEPLEWKLVDGRGETVDSGWTIFWGPDAASGERLHIIDFSDFTQEGTGYILEAGGWRSHPFDISSSLYNRLKLDALAYFYHNRSGITIEAQYVGQTWARPAGHLSDQAVTCYRGRDKSGKEWPGCDYTLDVAGGWYDAGDWGKYVVNGGIAVWTLLNAYERNPAAFGDGDLSVPEQGNGVPDILDEVRWEIEFLLKMQVPAGHELAGMVHHKLHDARWAGMPAAPPAVVDNNNPAKGRFLFPPSTAATLNLAAVGAQCARLWRGIDAGFADRCLMAAKTAWEAATAHPDMYAPSFDAGGGDYGDGKVKDDFYWAAAELYLATGDEVYRDYLTQTPYYIQLPALAEGRGGTAMDWASTAALGTISLALVTNDLPPAEIVALRQQIIGLADLYLATQSAQGYGVPLPVTDYYWGSNSLVANDLIIMALAHQFTSERKYLDGVTVGMDYLLGVNPNNKSYVSGYGENSLQHPHHRFWANRDAYPPPPPGALAGGPNAGLQDDVAKRELAGCAPAKCYIDLIGSYSTNEVAINWNAPLAWVAWYLDERLGRPTGEATPTQTALPPPATVAPVALPPVGGNAMPPWAWIIVGAVVVVIAAGAYFIWKRRQ